MIGQIPKNWLMIDLFHRNHLVIGLTSKRFQIFPTPPIPDHPGYDECHLQISDCHGPLIRVAYWKHMGWIGCG